MPKLPKVPKLPKINETVKSQCIVIPAKAGIQSSQKHLDSSFRRSDGTGSIYGSAKINRSNILKLGITYSIV